MTQRIIPLDNRASTLSDIADKINEMIFTVNELIKKMDSLKPGWTEGENKGYENEVLDNYKIKEPE